MNSKPFILRPQTVYLLLMIIQLIVLLIILIPVFNVTVFCLFLLLCFSLVLRWRLTLKPHYMLIDLLIFLICTFIKSEFSWYLFIFAYYFSYNKKLIFIVPLIIVGIINNDSIPYYLLVLQACLFGTILYYWHNEVNNNKIINDKLRQHIYDLELTQSQLLMDYQDTEKISRLSERQRIAEILHDNLGHELTAAQLSLRAYKTLISINKDEKAQETLKKAEQRLNNALDQLKETVSNVEPHNDIGIDYLNSLFANFIYPVNFKHQGDITKLKPYIWQLVQISIKEALTNVVKHAMPTRVDIELEVTNYILRLVIENNGIKEARSLTGHGLRYMRSRLEALNGSLSIQNGKTFRLIIIIPINNR